MWKFRRKSEDSDLNKIPNSVAIALIISTVALALVAGVVRWSWLLLDEQIRLRQDLNDLKYRQAQVETQYEFWLQQLQDERAAIKK